MLRIRFVPAIVSIALATSATAQSPREVVHRALQNRAKMKGAYAQNSAARDIAASTSAYPLTRIETGDTTRPDPTGGEDLTLFQPIDIFGKTRAAHAAGAAVVRNADANLRLAQLNIQHETLTAYAALGNAIRSHVYALSQLKTLKQVAEATRKLVGAKVLPETQLIRAELELSRAEQIDIDRLAAIQVARVRMQQAMGVTELNFTESGTEPIEPTLLKKADPEHRLPEMLSLMAERDGFHADFEAAKLSRLPDVEIQVRRTPFSSFEDRYGVRLELIIPLWDHGAAKNKMAAARKQSQASSLEILDLKSRIAADIESATIQVNACQRSLAAYERIVDGSKVILAKTKRGFELGALSLLEVFDAKRSLDDALAGLASAQYSLDLAVEAALQAQGQLLEDK